MKANEWQMKWIMDVMMVKAGLMSINMIIKTAFSLNKHLSTTRLDGALGG